MEQEIDGVSYKWCGGDVCLPNNRGTICEYHYHAKLKEEQDNIGDDNGN